LKEFFIGWWVDFFGLDLHPVTDFGSLLLPALNATSQQTQICGRL